MGKILNEVNGLLSAANSTIDSYMAAAKSFLCLPSIISSFLSPSLYIKGIAGLITNIKNGILSAVTGIINEKVGQIAGIISQQIGKITSIFNDIAGSLQSINQFINSLWSTANGIVDALKSQQNCANAGADLFSCLTKVVANKLTNKVVSTIDSKLSQVTNDIVNDIAIAGGPIDSFVNRQSDMVAKVRKQIQL